MTWCSGFEYLQPPQAHVAWIRIFWFSTLYLVFFGLVSFHNSLVPRPGTLLCLRQGSPLKPLLVLWDMAVTMHDSRTKGGTNWLVLWVQSLIGHSMCHQHSFNLEDVCIAPWSLRLRSSSMEIALWILVALFRKILTFSLIQSHQIPRGA